MSRRILIVPVLAAAAAALFFLLPLGQVPTADAKASSSTSNTSFTIALDVFVPCANGGAGEVVSLSGELHDLFHVTIDNGGGLHIDGHDNPQGVSGVGLVTGTKYQATGVTLFSTNVKPAGFPFETTFVNNFRIIGAGPGNNLLVHDLMHVTVNAKGQVTATHNISSIECK